MVKKENTTVVTTKSGTKVYVVGKYRDKNIRLRAGDDFVNYFNSNFTVKEQLQIGNVYYDLYNRNNTGTQIPKPKMGKKNWAAQTGTFTGSDAQQLNPGYPKMVDTSFKPDVRNDESAVTHELIHAKKFMRGVAGNKHNERKTDFEMIGRISEEGINELQHGYYFSPEGNATLRSKKGITLKEKGAIAKRGAITDRELLTGSVEKNMIGKPIETKSDKLFRKSWFFKKSF